MYLGFCSFVVGAEGDGVARWRSHGGNFRLAQVLELGIYGYKETQIKDGL